MEREGIGLAGRSHGGEDAGGGVRDRVGEGADGGRRADEPRREPPRGIRGVPSEGHMAIFILIKNIKH